METTDLLYWLCAFALITFGFWGVIDAIKQVKKNK
jgi:hypothetical protein